MARRMEQKTSRRSLFKYAFATLGTLIAPPADETVDYDEEAGYVIIDRRSLPIGGVGLFLVVPPAPSAEDIEKLGQYLDERFKDEPNVMAEVFDEAESARTVRSGSRIAGEEAFSAALAHQKATYRKTAKPPSRVLTIK